MDLPPPPPHLPPPPPHLPPPPPPPTEPRSHTHSIPPLPPSKIRLMCSFGGHIIPRPHNKSLFYAGGETRIVAVDRRTTAANISSLSRHLSRTLFGNRPFTLKYQLPNEDLDFLVSVTTDEDLQNMLEEHDRLAAAAPAPSPSRRIRLFLFPCKAESVGSLLLDPKSESWFSDALKSSMIINRGLSAEGGLMGLDCLNHPDSSSNDESVTASSGGCGGGDGRHGGGACDSGSMPESIALETCSFGSTSSSFSMSNSPPIGAAGDDGGAANLVDVKSKAAPPVSGESLTGGENSTASVVSHQKNGIYQDQAVPAAPLANVSSSISEPESIIYNPSSMIHLQKPVQASGHHQPPYVPEQKHQQALHYVHTRPHYIQQYPTGPVPVSSYYPMYAPYHQPNQPYPVYLVPLAPTTQSCNIPGPSDHTQNIFINPHVSYKEVVTSQPKVIEQATEAYLMGLSTTPFNNASSSTHHHNQNQQSDTVSCSTVDASYDNGYDDDLAYAQIYKTQPPAPKLETMA